MLHDPEKYQDPSMFIPERFLHEDGTLDTELPRMWNSVLDLVAGESCLMRITGFNINA